MPFEIVRNDITNMQVDAIVNTANPKPIIGSGTDTMVHQKAGPQLLLARQEIGDIPRGNAAITPAYNLNAKYVIHTVGPVWLDGTQGEDDLLRRCYDNSLKLALEHDCQSIAFPLISTENYGFPKDKALQIAIAAFSTFALSSFFNRKGKNANESRLRCPIKPSGLRFSPILSTAAHTAPSLFLPPAALGLVALSAYQNQNVDFLRNL